MREDGKFLEMIIVLFEIVKIPKHGLASAAIEQIASFNCRSCTGGIFDVDPHAFVFKSDVLHVCFFANFSAVFARMIEQELIELGASNLIGTVAT